MNPSSGSAGSPTSTVHGNVTHYTPNLVLAHQMSTPLQIPHFRNVPSVDPAGMRSDTGGLPVPIYTTQEVVRHSVTIPTAPRQHNGPQNTRSVEQNVAIGSHPHFQYNRDYPQIPSSTHPVNTHHAPPNTHHPQNPLPSNLRTQPDNLTSPLDRTSTATLPTRRQSDPSRPEQAQSAQQPAFNPVILSVTDNALAPVRSALDAVWSLAVNNMRLAMNKMNNDFTYLATQERQRNTHLMNVVSSLEDQLQAAQQDVQVLRNERQGLQNIIQAYKDNNEKLHLEKEQWELERRILTGMEGRRANSEVPQFDMNKVLGAVTEQVSKQMEQQMTAMMVQIEEQRSLRTQADQRFAETPQNLSHIQSRESFETSPTVLQFPSSSYILAQSPSLKRSHSPTSICAVSPISSGDMDVSADRRSMSPKTSPVVVSTPAEICTRTTPSPTRRRTSSCDQQPRKKPRLTNEREDGSQTPNLITSAAICPDVTKDPHPQPEALEVSGTKDGDLSREDNKEGFATVKPEPPDVAEVYLDIKGSKEATPSPRVCPPIWAPVRKSTPKPMHNTPANLRNTKLGIGHIDLLYRTDNGMMTCRMCLSRSREVLLSRDSSGKVAPVKKFEQEKANWDELISHCRDDHPKTCRDLEKLGPTQIAEMKQRLVSGEKPLISRA